MSVMSVGSSFGGCEFCAFLLLSLSWIQDTPLCEMGRGRWRWEWMTLEGIVWLHSEQMEVGVHVTLFWPDCCCGSRLHPQIHHTFISLRPLVNFVSHLRVVSEISIHNRGEQKTGSRIERVCVAVSKTSFLFISHAYSQTSCCLIKVIKQETACECASLIDKKHFQAYCSDCFTCLF